MGHGLGGDLKQPGELRVVATQRVRAPAEADHAVPSGPEHRRHVFGLVAADRASDGFREGALAAIAVSLAGMAGGRLVSLVVEPAGLRGYPALFLAVEAALAGALVLAL